MTIAPDCFCAICHDVILPHEAKTYDPLCEAVHVECYDAAIAQAELISASDEFDYRYDR